MDAFAVLVSKQEAPMKTGYFCNRSTLVKSSYQVLHSIHRCNNTAHLVQKVRPGELVSLSRIKHNLKRELRKPKV